MLLSLVQAEVWKIGLVWKIRFFQGHHLNTSGNGSIHAREKIGSESFTPFIRLYYCGSTLGKKFFLPDNRRHFTQPKMYSYFACECFGERRQEPSHEGRKLIVATLFLWQIQFTSGETLTILD